MPPDALYAPLEPFQTGHLQVDTLHTLYWEQCGQPEGIPMLFIHGGPGAGCSETDRRFFDPQHFCVVLFDQRGSGRSRPLGELRRNGSDLLVADIEQLRDHLGIDRWHVFGGSWGSTLALHYAQTHPDRCLSLVLRGIWLFRKTDLDWWLYGIGRIQPEIWRGFAEFVPQQERKDLLQAYYRRLTGADRETALSAAKSWSIYEGSCCTLRPNPEFSSAFAQQEMAWSLARLEAHYFKNERFDPEDRLLRRIDRIRHIPAFIVHGRYDIVCPIDGADQLHRCWPEASYVIVEDAGHSSHEPGIARQLVDATDRIKATGSPQICRGLENTEKG